MVYEIVAGIVTGMETNGRQRYFIIQVAVFSCGKAALVHVSCTGISVIRSGA
jgi:hypothetical protein